MAGLKRELLRNYQNAGVNHILNVKKGALWMFMGLGKTITVLTAILDLYRSCEVRKVLVIAPKRVALHTWPTEIGQWEHTSGLSHTVIAGSIKIRTAKLREKTDIHIIGRESVPWLVETLGHYWDYDMVVIDESSSFKSHKAKRFKSLRLMFNKITRLVELTGTPAPNGLLDLWSQAYLLDQGAALGKNITAYRKTYFYPKPGFFGWALKSQEHAKLIYEKLQEKCFTIKHSDYIELPEVLVNRIDVVLPPKARTQYKILEKELFLAFEDGSNVEAEFAAVLQNKLIQVCNGAIYVDEDKNYNVIHDAKLEALDSIIEESGGEPILCAYNYQSDMERILKRYKNKVTLLDSDPATLDKWNRGEIEFLLCHPASAGHGLNLQHGGHTLVWFGLNWSLELYLQFNARLARPGQKNEHVVMHQISTSGTVEDRVFTALNNKALTQEELVEFMKRPIL